MIRFDSEIFAGRTAAACATSGRTPRSRGGVALPCLRLLGIPNRKEAKMLMAFELSMPGVNSWNGRSGGSLQ